MSNEQDIDVLERFKVIDPIKPKKQEPVEKTNSKKPKNTTQIEENKHITTDQTQKKEQKPNTKINVFNPNPPVKFGPKNFKTIIDVEGVLLKDVIVRDKDGLALWTQVYCELKTDYKLMQFRFNDGEIIYHAIVGRLSIMLDDGSAVSIDANGDLIPDNEDRIIIPRGRRHNVINVIPGTTACFFMNIEGELDFRELLKD